MYFTFGLATYLGKALTLGAAMLFCLRLEHTAQGQIDDAISSIRGAEIRPKTGVFNALPLSLFKTILWMFEARFRHFEFSSTDINEGCVVMTDRLIGDLSVEIGDLMTGDGTILCDVVICEFKNVSLFIYVKFS